MHMLIITFFKAECYFLCKHILFNFSVAFLELIIATISSIRNLILHVYKHHCAGRTSALNFFLVNKFQIREV